MMRFDELGFADQLIVWAAREWIQIRSTDEPRAARLAEAFEQAGAPGAIAHLDATLGGLAKGARRRLDFRCPCDVMLGADEVWLLLMVGGEQDRRLENGDAVADTDAAGVIDEHGAALLRNWAGHDAGPELQRGLSRLAAELAAAGLRVSGASRRDATSKRCATSPRYGLH